MCDTAWSLRMFGRNKPNSTCVELGKFTAEAYYILQTSRRAFVSRPICDDDIWRGALQFRQLTCRSPSAAATDAKRRSQLLFLCFSFELPLLKLVVHVSEHTQLHRTIQFHQIDHRSTVVSTTLFT